MEAAVIQVIPSLHRLVDLLRGECVFVGGVVDWIHFGRPVRDIDLHSANGHLLPGARGMSGQFFGHKWRTRLNGLVVECFADPCRQWTWHAPLGIQIETPTHRLHTIQRILQLPDSRWVRRKRDRLLPLVARYESLIYSECL